MMNTEIEKIKGILTSEFTVEGYTDFLQEIFDSVQIIAPNNFRKEFSNFSSHIESYSTAGKYLTPDGKNIAMFAIQLKKDAYVENSRGVQRSFARNLIDSGNFDAAIIAFFTPGDKKWRLSFVRLEYEMKVENGRFKAVEELTPARRYSFLVGKDEPCHTAISRFRNFIINRNYNPTIEDLEEAFSVEKVTNEFYNLYCEKFHQLREALESNEDFVIEAKQHNFTSAQFAKKLMGQIVFLYFLQKKGWLGVKAWPNELNEKEYKNAYYASGAKSRELIPLVYRKVSDDLYKVSPQGLESLSDEDEKTLSKCVKGNAWGTGPHNFMRKLFEIAEKRNINFYDEMLEPLFYDALNVNRGEAGYCPALHCRVPFLAGGLFEPIDGYEWENNDFAIPNSIFSNVSEKGEYDADGILDVFDRYNFTMSEDEPLEREVAIDPEMLGKVFENLLEIDDRKSKGAFYTPREIVHYMCQESLINYLTSSLSISEEAIRDFILYGEIMKDEDTSKEKRANNGGLLISAELFAIDENDNVVVNRLIDVDNALKDVRVADPAVGSGAFPVGLLSEIVKARQTITAYFALSMNAYQKRLMYMHERSPHTLKYETIKNSIYAADVEPSAVDIAQLRLWLSLVIDDEINPDAQNDLEGHKNPLPLPNLECNIVCGNSLIDEFKGIKLINQSDILGNQGGQLDLNQSGFDAVLQQLIQKQDELYKCKDTNHKHELLSQISSLKDILIHNQLEGASPETLAEYEASKHLAAKPYVLWQIDFARVFREKGGFDIVIGNPPYLRERDNKRVFEAVNNTSFGVKYHQGKMDYWYYFLHKAIDLISSKGCISYITPRYWLNSAGATNLIKRIKEELSFIEIVDIGKLKVFDNVVGYHMIAQYSKKKHDRFICKRLINNLSDINKMNDTDNLSIAYLNNDSIITSNYEIQLEKLDYFDGCIELGTIADISQGVVEAPDRVSKKMLEKYPREDIFVGKGVFVLTEDEVNQLGLTESEKKILVKYADGDNIRRYCLSDTNKYLIYSDKINKELIAESKEYKNLKKHLDSVSEYITSSNAPYGLHRPRKRLYFEQPKIIMPSMFAESCFVIDYSENLYVGMSYSCIVINSSDYLIEYILAILNSTVAHSWFYSTGKKRGVGVDIGVDKIRSFPIKPCELERQEEIAKLVRQLQIENGQNKAIDRAIDKEISDIYRFNSSEL